MITNLSIYLLAIIQVWQIQSLNAQDFISEGPWRGVFTSKEGTEIPVNFEVKGHNADNAIIYLLNAEERLEVKRLSKVKDSLFIYFDDFDNELALKISKHELSGVLRKQKTGLKISAPAGAVSQTPLLVPFKASFGLKYRFPESRETPLSDITGKWDVTFTDNDGKESMGVGIFTQTGNKLKGTFMKTTGDARYLEGLISGNTFYMSTFIGSAPNLITGTLDDANTLNGFSGGATGKIKFRAIRNIQAELPDAYTLTSLKPGYHTLDFSLPDVEGNVITLKDKKYKNKVVVLTISGTWCPNCVDEANFLAPWYKKNRDRGVEVLTIFYERKTDPAYVNALLTRYKKKHGIEYDQVFGGLADKKGVLESIPALHNFLSFPTTFFIDKSGNVAKIHTGYTGPATGKYYEDFVMEFNGEIDWLLAGNPAQVKISSEATKH